MNGVNYWDPNAPGYYNPATLGFAPVMGAGTADGMPTTGSLINRVINTGLDYLTKRLGGPPARIPPRLPPVRTGTPPIVAPRGGGGGIGRTGAVIVGGAAAYEIGKWIYDEFGNIIGQRRHHRRMNVLNARALRRAMRRVQGLDRKSVG